MKNYDTPVPANDDVLRDAPGLEFPDWRDAAASFPHDL